MLHKETVEAGTLDLIQRLMTDKNLQEFYLVGGTALSLKLGHRLSIDIDMFTGKDFDSSRLSQHLHNQYGLTDAINIKNGVFGFIDQIKVDFISHQYPLVKPVELSDGIRMLSMQDIGAMKLHAIVQNSQQAQGLCGYLLYFGKNPVRLVIKSILRQISWFQPGYCQGWFAVSDGC